MLVFWRRGIGEGRGEVWFEYMYFRGKEGDRNGVVVGG